MRLFLSFCAAMLATINFAYADLAELNYSGRNVIYHSDVKLSGSQKRDVRDARKADFFGAVAINTVNKKYEASGAAWGYHTLETAQSVALRSCQFKADNPEDCVLYLSVVPKGFSTSTEAQTLSKTGVDAYNFVIKWARVNFDEYRSFATNGIHTWSYSAPANSQQVAEQDALEICERTFAKSQARKDPAWANAVYNKAQMKCRILTTFSPK